MNGEISPYWDERTVFIYGLLAGYTKLKPKQVVGTLNEFVNDQHNVVHCINLLKELEIERLIIVGDLTVENTKYRHQLEAELDSDEDSNVLPKIEDALEAAYIDPYQKELDFSSVTKMVSHEGFITKSLHNCISFNLRIKDASQLTTKFSDYLSRFQKDELYSASKAYTPYKEQRFTLLDWLDNPEVGDKLVRFMVSDTTRFLETLFSLVDEDRLFIKEFGDVRNTNSPVFSTIVERRSGEPARPQPPSYDAKTRQLTFLNATITIEQYSHQELFCKTLFRGGKPVKQGVEKGDILEAFGLDTYGKSSKEKDAARRKIYSVKNELNRRIRQKAKIEDDLFTVKKLVWFNPKYL